MCIGKTKTDMEEDVQKLLLNFIRGLQIANCDTYLVRPSITGLQEGRQRSYVTIGYPNGIVYKGAFAYAEGLITIGTKDKRDALGLPNAGEITRISNIIRKAFPYLSDDYSLLDFEFSSDDSDGMGWHEYYYSFHIYINKSN